MRGSRTCGWILALAMIMSFSIPVAAKAQAASAQQYYAAGTQMHNARNYTQAIQYFNAAIKLNPSYAAAYQGAGNSYYAMGNKQNALAYYQRASALQPTNTQLAQFVQNLKAQVSGGGAAAGGGMGLSGANPLNQGAALFQQKQYAASLPYFRQAIQQNPNDYRGYYYSGYAYYMTGNAKYAAFYFGVANAKQPNASIKAYADRVKASLGADDQQWVDNQVSQYGGAAVAGGGGAAKKSDLVFGFHLLGGIEYILADPTAITKNVAAAGGVSLSGVTPNIVAFPEIQPYIRFGDFEVNLAIGYFPVGNLSYTTYDYKFFFSPSPPDPPGTSPDVLKYTFNTTIVTADLGGKFLFGDKDVKGYIGLAGGISPISMTFTKVQYDSTGTNVLPNTTSSSGNYTTMAINGHAMLGVDFYLGKGIAIGPYVGYRYLSATNFQGPAGTLLVNGKTGAVGVPADQDFMASDPTTPLVLDFSGITGGLNLTFGF
jgi:tetratricopeptide (TPR) repeat protein